MSETKGAGAGTGSGAALGPGAGPGAAAAGVGGGGAPPGVLLLPAVMVSELEAEDVAHLQTPGVRPAPFYVCLGADNRLMRVGGWRGLPGADNLMTVISEQPPGADKCGIVWSKITYYMLEPRFR